MADDIMANTELGATKQELIANLVQKELAFQAKLTQFFTNVSAYAVAGAKSISFPKLSSFTVGERVEGTAGEATAITATLDTLLLNINAYLSWVIDAMTLKQANIPAQLESAKRAASAQARYVDTKIITALLTYCGFFVNAYSATPEDVDYDDYLAMSQKMEEKHQNMSDCVWLISPAQKAATLKLDEFKRADVYGTGNIPSGVVGWILGAPVVVHSGLPAKQVLLAHRESIAYGFQAQAQYGEQDAIEYGVGAKKAAIDQLFGVVGLQQGQGGATAGKSPLIVGLNDPTAP